MYWAKECSPPRIPKSELYSTEYAYLVNGNQITQLNGRLVFAVKLCVCTSSSCSVPRSEYKYEAREAIRVTKLGGWVRKYTYGLSHGTFGQSRAIIWSGWVWMCCCAPVAAAQYQSCRNSALR